MFLTHLAEKKCTVSELRNSYPSYYMSKNKIQLTPDLDVDGILKSFHEKHRSEKVTTIDGVKVDFADCWVHLRKSNTEPIIRIYTEALSQQKADDLAQETMASLQEIAGV